MKTFLAVAIAVSVAANAYLAVTVARLHASQAYTEHRLERAIMGANGSYPETLR